jgi:uncharacterized protein YbjT (DUF2867 family)
MHMNIAVAGSTGLVGRNVVRAAKAAGHDVIELARNLGTRGSVDLTLPEGLAERLAGADAVVDVTQGPSLQEAEATAFFEVVARSLGGAARKAGVSRTVVLSIIGLEDVPEYRYYAAKLAQERAMTEYAPDVHVLRAAQFLDFPGQMLDWNRDGDRVVIPEMRTQPVAVEEIARLLVAMADGSETRPRVELAGPRVEDLADLVRRVVAHRGEKVTVEVSCESKAMASGACLPGPDAIIAGPDFATWLAAKN